MKAEELRSVRVEVDDLSGGPQAPVAPSGEPRNQASTLAFALGGLLLIVAMIFVLRPAGDEAADGSIRGLPASTTLAPTTTTLAPADDAERADDDASADEPEIESVHRRIQGISGSAISSVVRADVGYLAALWVWESQGQSLLYSSIDGLEWTAVEARFPDEIVEARLSGNLVVSHLRQTADGYSLLAHTFSVDGDTEQAATASRLVSPNGIEWEVQTRIAAPPTSGVYPLLHTDEIWGYMSMGSEDTLKTELLETHMVDAELLSGPSCWVDAESEERLMVFPCDFSAPVELGVEDFIDQVSLRQLAHCAEELDWFESEEATIIDNETGQELRRILIPRTVQVAEQGSSSGAIVGVTQVAPWRNGVPACDGLIDVPAASAGPVAMIWDNDSTEARTVALPESLVSPSGINMREAFVRDDVVVVQAGHLWTLDLQSLAWTEGRRLEGSGAFSNFVDDSGDVLVRTGARSDVYVTDLESASTRVVETGLAERFDWIVYADEDIALLGGSTSGSVYRIDLHAESPTGADEN